MSLSWSDCHLPLWKTCHHLHLLTDSFPLEWILLLWYWLINCRNLQELFLVDYHPISRWHSQQLGCMSLVRNDFLSNLWKRKNMLEKKKPIEIVNLDHTKNVLRSFHFLLTTKRFLLGHDNQIPSRQNLKYHKFYWNCWSKY